MELNNIPEKYRDILVDIVAKDDTGMHFLWICGENKMISLGSSIFPEDVKDPFDYIRESGIIGESYTDTFNIFISHIEEGIMNGIDRNNLSVDVEMTLPPENKPLLCHFYTIFLLDESSRIVAVHGNIRPFSVREVFDSQVLDVFTSDKAPQLFGRRCLSMLNAHPDDNVAFIQFDIERFKLINENYSVEIGDELLKFINDSLGMICGDDIPYCRLTADVFMVVIDFTEENEVTDFIHNLESRLTGYKGMDYRLIFGVAIAEDRTLHTRRHGDNASLARQETHGNALNNIGWYNGKMKSDLHKVQNIESDMNNALLNNEFVMFLQPKHSISTGRIIGAEALARWQHPEKGMISPAVFIPVFEKNGFILKLDRVIWEKACIQIRSWIDRGIDPVPVSVNISREYVHTFDIVSHMRSLIDKYNIPIGLLELEITESVDAEGVEDVVKKMKQAGFTMLMDDFGSGYSSLNMLKSTQFDVLKIDKGFLSEFMDSERGRKIISHTISMSHDIGLDIVAEGVETIEQVKFLEKCGCDSVQGFFYSKPVAVDEFEQKLKEANK